MESYETNFSRTLDSKVIKKPIEARSTRFFIVLDINLKFGSCTLLADVTEFNKRSEKVKTILKQHKLVLNLAWD